MNIWLSPEICIRQANNLLLLRRSIYGKTSQGEKDAKGILILNIVRLNIETRS